MRCFVGLSVGDGVLSLVGAGVAISVGDGVGFSQICACAFVISSIATSNVSYTK